MDYVYYLVLHFLYFSSKKVRYNTVSCTSATKKPEAKQNICSTLA